MARIGIFLCAVSLAFAASVASADDIKGKVNAIDPDKRTITVNVGDKDQTFEIAQTAKVYRLSGNNARRAGYAEAPGGIKEVAVGSTVTLTTEFIDDKEQATRIKIESASSQPLRRPKDNPPPPKESTTNDVDGSVVALDGRRLQMTLNVDGKPRKFTVTKDCSVLLAVKGGKRKTPVRRSPQRPGRYHRWLGRDRHGRFAVGQGAGHDGQNQKPARQERREARQVIDNRCAKPFSLVSYCWRCLLRSRSQTIYPAGSWQSISTSKRSG